MRHDKDLLKESLDIEDIQKILIQLGATSTQYNESRDELVSNTVCHNVSDGSMKLYYRSSTHSFFCFTGCSCSMDVYELVRKSYSIRGVELSFADAVNWVAEKTGRSFGFNLNSDISTKENSEMVWLERFTKKKVEYPELKTYNDNILNVFDYGFYHENFTGDHISIEAMKKFQIGFHSKSERITIPHRHYVSGKIISIRGRATRQDDIDSGKKYLPLTIQGHLYSHPSYLSLYGLWENKETIKKLKKVIVFESEKSVLQCESFFPDNNFSVALSGRNMSQVQIGIILSMGIEEIIFATDKMFESLDSNLCDNDKQFILKLGRKFSPYVRTYTLFDAEGLIEYKSSPSDAGKEILMRLMATKKEIMNAE